MNWLAMGRRLVVGADAPRNQTLTLVVALLAAGGASAFDGSVSLELAGGNKTLAGSLIGDWGVVPERLYVVGTVGVIKQQVTDPNITSQPSWLVGLGLDWVPSMHFNSSLNVSFSPKATDAEALNAHPAIDASSTRRSAQALLG